MATKTDIITIARNYLRDFPRFFQLTFDAAGRTYALGKPNIDPESLWVAYTPSSGGGASVTVIPSTDYSLDSRNGLLRLPSTLIGANQFMVEGYYYEWLTPADLDFYADMAIDLNTHNLDVNLADVAPAVANVIGVYTLVQALWGLLSEYSRDIDVITSESVHIIASQRYRMVSDLLSTWTEEYNKMASALNIGLGRIEMVTLRRISKTTNRYVPIYKGREVGDYAPVERLWPAIDDGIIDITTEGDELRSDVFVDGEPPPGYLSVGYF